LIREEIIAFFSNKIENEKPTIKEKYPNLLP
jgi:hypothetical protein